MLPTRNPHFKVIILFNATRTKQAASIRSRDKIIHTEHAIYTEVIKTVVGVDVRQPLSILRESTFPTLTTLTSLSLYASTAWRTYTIARVL